MVTTSGNDWSVYYVVLQPSGMVSSGAFLFYVAFMEIALVNILTGIFVENAIKMAEPDRTAISAEQQRQHYHTIVELEEMMKAIDTDGDGNITEEEFVKALDDDSGHMRTYLGSIGVHTADAKRFFCMLKAASFGKPIMIQTVVGGCMRLVEGAQAIDLQGLGCELRIMHKKFIDFGKEFEMLRNCLSNDTDERYQSSCTDEESVLV